MASEAALTAAPDPGAAAALPRARQGRQGRRWIDPRWLAGAIGLLVSSAAFGTAAADPRQTPADALALADLLVPAAAVLLPLAAALVVWMALRLRNLRRAEARLNAGLEDARAYAEAVEGCAVVVRDLTGRVIRWSRGCERLFGHAGAEVRGRLLQEILVTRYPAGGRRTAEEMLLRDGHWHGKLRHRRQDGRQVTVAAHWILQRNTATGAPAGVLEVHAEATSLEADEAALRAGEARLRLAQEVAAIGTWEWDPETDVFVFSAEHAILFGGPAQAAAPHALNGFLAMLHRDDREAVRQAFAQALESGEYEVEFRVPRRIPGSEAEEEVRWMIGRGRRMPGPVGRVGPILGVHVDITARKEAEQRQALLMREVDHRAKNALAVVQAFLRLTSADSPAAFARAVEDRITALARTHTLLAEQSWSGVELRSLLASELAPFIGADGGGRVRLDGLPVVLPPVLVQPLSIVLHELATNATKYGALSTAGGTLEIAWEILRSRRALSLRWTEQGGPVIPGVPERRGFGSRVIEQTMRRQLGGTCTLHWRPEGLLFEAEVPLPQTNALAGTPLPPPGPPPRGAGRPALSTVPADYPRRSTA